ncbi:amidohydrolase family protein [Chitinophaga vietnamensis]|uniref:amidohydrolase family protein n=1 Tax=Chitinophaga vietnamensis TaxID=2593957 RepID=UPI0011787D67|nr:amidohydrolase family protein [Chitinophaga vietnamensis]
MPYYNVHTHIFTMNNAPRRFLHLYLPDAVADLVDKITNTSSGTAVVQRLLSWFGGNGGKRYASFLQIGKSKNQREVFEDLKQRYDDDTLAFIALTMFMEKCGADTSGSGYEGQLEEIIQVKREYPDRLFVFMGIDPRWKLTGHELRTTVESYFERKINVTATRSVYPFIGLKLYPCMGFYPFDERLKETFEWAQDNGVPIISHCNYLGGIYNNDESYIQSSLNPVDPYSGSTYSAPKYISDANRLSWIMGKYRSTNNMRSCSYFMEPASYISMLKSFEERFEKMHLKDDLKMCLAHFGGGNEILAKPTDIPYGVAGVNWYNQVQAMLTRFPQLYTDVSYAIYDSKIFDTVYDELNKPYGDRILFGTDFFLTEREQPEKSTFSNFRKYAAGKPLTNHNNVDAFDQIAQHNIERFLQSKYF